jgi:hypothetical protein
LDKQEKDASARGGTKHRDSSSDDGNAGTDL